MSSAAAGPRATPAARSGTSAERGSASLGYGQIGCRVGEQVAAFGMRVLAYVSFASPPAEVASSNLEELVAASDVLRLHLPLTPESYHLVLAGFLAATRRGAASRHSIASASRWRAPATRSALLSPVDPDSDRDEPCWTRITLIRSAICWLLGAAGEDLAAPLWAVLTSGMTTPPAARRSSIGRTRPPATAGRAARSGRKAVGDEENCCREWACCFE